MKKLFAFAPFAVLAAIAACGPRKTVDSPIDVADKSDPVVAQGKTLYTANCSKCHSFADPQLLPDDKWPEVVEEMGQKAKLGDDDRKAVLRYILAAKRQGPNPPPAPSEPVVVPSDPGAAPPAPPAPPPPPASPDGTSPPETTPTPAPPPAPPPAPSTAPSGGPTPPSLPPTPGYVK